MNKRVISKSLDWEDIRAFLVRRKFLRGNELDEETFDAICNRNTRSLSGVLMRELSVWIDGYHVGRHGLSGARRANRR